ncbi:MAG: SRPBCC family protein [Gaiellaceae bacterium]
MSATRSSTQSVALAAPPEDVFAYVADAGNLPEWAIGFCKEIRSENGHSIVTTPSGEQVTIRQLANAELGTVDGILQFGPSIEGRTYTRVVPNGDGAEYVFTMLQPAGMPDEVFDGQVAELGRELLVLKARIETACPL